MSAFRLLIVEDNDQDLTVCRDTITRYKEEKQRDVEFVECKSVEEAFNKLDNSFDGAIIDLRLNEHGDEGNQVVSRIMELHYRMPIAILTGTPDAASDEFSFIGVFKKGEPGAGYADLLDQLWGIYNTGLTRIMGGRGVIEENLSKVFHKHILPHREKWVAYGENDSLRTESALLRHTLNHLLQLLDEDSGLCFPEEFYIVPPMTDGTMTGSIVKKIESEEHFVVLSPACDLVIRENGEYKTDRILVVEIDTRESVFPDYLPTNLSKCQKKTLEKAFKNNKASYYHWLPTTDFYCGGFLNFRKLSSLPEEEYKRRFETPKIQIAQSFIKDIIARFSAYYARQGQPDIDFKDLIEHSGK